MNAEKIAELLNAVLEREATEDEFISISNSFGTVCVHVSPDYFDATYQGAAVDVREQGRDYDRHSWTTPSGCEVFCLKPATWERVA